MNIPPSEHVTPISLAKHYNVDSRAVGGVWGRGLGRDVREAVRFGHAV